MSAHKMTVAEQKAALEELAALRQFKEETLAAQAPKGNYEFVIDFPNEEGEMVPAATLRVSGLSNIAKGLGSRLAGVLITASENVFEFEDDPEAGKGMSPEQAEEFLKAAQLRIERCKTRFEPKEEGEVDPYLAASREFKEERYSSRNGAGQQAAAPGRNFRATRTIGG